MALAMILRWICFNLAIS